jgi:hypothetical protein
MSIILILPYIAIAAWLFIRHTNRKLRAQALAIQVIRARSQARQLRQTWKAMTAKPRARCDYYPSNACVFGRRQGVEL